MSQLENISFPLCGDKIDKLLYRYHIDNEKVVLQKIKKHNPEWSVNDGVCSRCVDYYHSEPSPWLVSIKTRRPDARIAIAMPPRIGTSITVMREDTHHGFYIDWNNDSA